MVIVFAVKTASVTSGENGSNFSLILSPTAPSRAALPCAGCCYFLGPIFLHLFFCWKLLQTLLLIFFIKALNLLSHLSFVPAEGVISLCVAFQVPCVSWHTLLLDQHGVAELISDCSTALSQNAHLSTQGGCWAS